MLDNQKRAHDLAIAMVSIGYSMFINDESRPATATFDAYAEYKTSYDSVIESFTRDFPET